MKKIIYCMFFLLNICLAGCMNFTTDISHTDHYSEIIGKNAYLNDGRCFYWAVPGEWTYAKYSIEHFSIEKTNICNENASVPEYYKAIEILPAGTKVKIVKVLRMKDAGGNVWDYIVGVVYSKKLKKEVEFEYFLGFSDDPDPMPWSLEQSN